MSFILDFRKKLQRQQREALRVRKINQGFVTLPPEDASDTPNNRRRVLLALVIAYGVLAVFNSGGLVHYTQGLAGNSLGQKLIVASERWHELMQRKHVTRVVEEIRGSVAFVRASSWHDLTQGLRIKPVEAQPARPDDYKVVPAKEETPPPRQDNEREFIKPSGPVLRASVERSL
ncbi:MAG: hypothetical protein ACE5FM_03660 [Methyloligellaceae bacterium]